MEVMIYIEGKGYPTIADAAAVFGVSTRAVRDYIDRGIIDPPPTIFQGLREIAIYPPDYLERATEQVARHRKRRRQERKSNRSTDD
jgi:hypothetical protein